LKALDDRGRPGDAEHRVRAAKLRPGGCGKGAGSRPAFAFALAGRQPDRESGLHMMGKVGA